MTSRRKSPEGEPESLPKLDGLIVGELVSLDDAGVPWVEFHGNPAGAPIAARSLVELDAPGQRVALVFEGGDPSLPLVLGIVRRSARRAPVTSQLEVEVDRERVELRAKREIVLRVGKASITLTEAGKVLIRGAHLVSRSSGVNRIKGGSVQIN